MKPLRVLSVNPGSTSTKIAVYEDETCLYKENLKHETDVLGRYANILEQTGFREALVVETLQKNGHPPESMHAIVGRGGFLPNLHLGGTYVVDDAMCETLRTRALQPHASNLGAIMAKSLADACGLPAFVVDPVSVDEVGPLGKVSGLKGVERRTVFHCLNAKAAARQAAAQLGRPYAQLNLVVTHLGGGISVSAHTGGKAVDTNCCVLGEGCFSPERAGTLALSTMLDLAFDSGKSRAEIEKMLYGGGGLVGYLGTNDCLKVDDMVLAGDAEATLVYEAMAYQVAKDMAAMAAVLKGGVDALVLTGSLARSDILVKWITERVSFIAPVVLLPGEFEHLAMTQGALRVLRGEEEALRYTG